MTPTAAAAAYARAFGLSGPAEDVQLVRQGDANAYLVRAWVTDFVPSDLAGAVEQGRRNAVVLASSVAASGFPLPFKLNQDRLKWALSSASPKSNAITKIDDATRRVQGVLIAYELDLEGA